MSATIPSIRKGHSRPQVTKDLGVLAELSGTWEGFGFNLIGRPDKQGNSPVFLELNQTFETLSFIPISSTIPNRGFAVDDIQLFGLTYLQKITDIVTGGALHIEPGIWIHIPSQDSEGTQSVARMGNIPHGNSLLAQGSAIKLDPFNGNPFDPDKVAAANTAPFPVEDAFPTTATPPGTGTGMPVPGTLSKFLPYDLSNSTPAAVNFRTPAGDADPKPLPKAILGVPMQQVILDPTKLLTAALSGQTISDMVVINIATTTSLLQQQPIPSSGAQPPPVDILENVQGAGGGIENIPFLQTNADAATMFATFWIEEISAPSQFLQLQYVQTVFLNFPILGVTPVANLSWPHVSVATLQKTFGGQ
jgi:hypothetical protein